MNLITVYLLVFLASLIAGSIYGWKQDGAFGSLVGGVLCGGIACCLMLLLFLIVSSAITLLALAG